MLQLHRTRCYPLKEKKVLGNISSRHVVSILACDKRVRHTQIKELMSRRVTELHLYFTRRRLCP